jgi:hypothetical protein
MLDRAIEELRRLPPVDPAAIRRIVSAAAEARISPADDPVDLRGNTGRSIRVWSAIGIAAAAAFAGFVVRGAVATKSAVHTIATTPAPPATEPALRPAVASSAESAPILQQFVFENAHARSVSVVGDFNKWNPTTSPMKRSSDAATWSVILPIIPGRHIYGYMVDDSVFTLDPRAPKIRDGDLGTEGSVVIVGRP